MRTAILKRAWRAFGQAHFIPQSRGVIVIVALLLAAANLFAGPVVNTLGGGNPKVNPKYLGFKDGITLSQALFHTPYGIAVDSTGQYLFVADRDNNAIRFLDLVAGWTWTFDVTYTNLINKPIAVAVDTYDYVYVLNRGNETNGSVVTFDNWGDAVATNAVRLTNAAGMALDSIGNIYLTVQSNKLIRIAAGTTNRTTIATIPNAGTSLQGIVVKHNGLIAACDSGRNGIYLINPATGVVTTNAGFHGTGDFTTNGNNIASSTKAMFNQPMCVAEAGDGTLIVTDYGNNRVKAVLASGVVTNLYGVTSKYWGGTYPGWYDGTVQVPDSIAPNVQSRLPVGVAFASDGTVYTTEDYYHTIRHVTGAGLQPPPPPPPTAPTILTVTTNYGQVILTWTASSGATSYNIKRSTSNGSETTIASTTATSYTDTNVLNGTTYYYVVSAINAGGEGPNSLEVSATPPIPPPPAPRIGWFDYEGNNATGFFTVLHPVSGANWYVAYNDLNIAVDPTTNGLSTYYITTNGPQPVLAVPSSTNGSTPPFYQDGLLFAQPLPVTTVPDLVIKAVNVGSGGSSPITTAEFLFQVANPIITGNNAAQFTVSDITSGAQLWYTTDGSDPTNAAPSQPAGTITGTNGITLSLPLPANTNMTFKVRGFRNGYLPSGIAVQSFSSFNFVPNTISFGFASGEASSDFVASPGQLFYAPVTLNVLPGQTIFSLQFNITVTNLSPAPALFPIFGFQSTLVKPIPGTDPPAYETIPPAMFDSYITNIVYVTNVTYLTNLVGTNVVITPTNTVSTNFVANPIVNPPPTNLIIFPFFDTPTVPFLNLEFVNSSLNLLGVGWLERFGAKNLYDTTKQDLIQYSEPHDTVFNQADGKVVLGGYAFLVPPTATPGQQYQIQIGRPSATSDGIGAPGSFVFIYTPTNGSLAGGSPINSIKNVTIGQRKYIAGDSAPFRWYNAGDFGNTNLENADVEQVFQSAIYLTDYPPFGSDFFDSMDSCGSIGAFDSTTGYYTNAFTTLNTVQLNALFDGNDTTINQLAFGDGNLDVCDVYVTYRRSLDSSLTWYRRFWTNGILAAETTPNIFNPSAISQPLVASKTLKPAISYDSPISITNQPKVNFVAGDFQATPSGQAQTIYIPITANVFGNYPLRLLMLNLTVIPLDGSPALTTPVQFTPNALLGQPYTTATNSVGNCAAVWLNSAIYGLTGNASIGTLSVTLPANATSLSAYAIHFDHASASPNGLASFPKQAKTGLITLSNRSGSSYNDGIPDSWRLRYFLTLNNLLSQTNADADGDGMNNLQEYLAGTDPTDPKSFFKNIGTDPSAAQQPQDCVISWPSASGKQYVIERSSSLSSPSWVPVSTNSGTGTIMEFHDSSGGGIRFYRVRVE